MGSVDQWVSSTCSGKCFDVAPQALATKLLLAPCSLGRRRSQRRGAPGRCAGAPCGSDAPRAAAGPAFAAGHPPRRHQQRTVAAARRRADAGGPAHAEAAAAEVPLQTRLAC